MDKISFRGIQNVGGIINHGKFRLALELTNSKTKDLLAFQNVLKAFPNAKNDNFMIIECVTDISGKNLPSTLLINNHEVKINDENLATFAKLAMLMQKIQNNKKKFPTNPKYLFSNYCTENIYSLQSQNSHEQKRLANKAHKFGRINHIAVKINKQINDARMDYFV